MLGMLGPWCCRWAWSGTLAPIPSGCPSTAAASLSRLASWTVRLPDAGALCLVGIADRVQPSHACMRVHVGSVPREQDASLRSLTLVNEDR